MWQRAARVVNAVQSLFFDAEFCGTVFVGTSARWASCRRQICAMPCYVARQALVGHDTDLFAALADDTFVHLTLSPHALALLVKGVLRTECQYDRQPIAVAQLSHLLAADAALLAACQAGMRHVCMHQTLRERRHAQTCRDDTASRKRARQLRDSTSTHVVASGGAVVV